MSREFGCLIDVVDIVPPLPTGNRYAGQIRRLVEYTDEGPVTMAHAIGERYGRTEEEARLLIRADVEQWAKDHEGTIVWNA